MSTTNVSNVEDLELPEDASYIGGVDLNPDNKPIEEGTEKAPD